MGRPREYDEHTAVALLDIAEQLVAEGGLDALSVRRVASAIGATIRAVYSLFGSKEGLITALGTRAFTLLRDELDALPTTEDPARDVVEAGVVVFRRFTRSHPALYTIGFPYTDVSGDIYQTFRNAQEEAFTRLCTRIGRLKQRGQLGPRSVFQAALEFHALCEGLAVQENRGFLPAEAADQTWRDALSALVAGWAVTK